MKKAFIIYGLGWVALIASFIIRVALPSYHEIAEDPQNIEKTIKIDLPDFAKTEYEDNLDRGASRWDVYIHRVTFAEELSEECIEKLEKRCTTDSKHWKKLAEQDCYLYTDEKGIDELYSVSCHIYKDCCTIDYTISEDEGLIFFFFWVIGFQIVNTYGFVIFIIWLIRKIRNRKKK